LSAPAPPLHDLAKSATATATSATSAATAATAATATAHNQQKQKQKTRAIGAVGRSWGLVEICGKTWKTCKTKVDKINSTHTLAHTLQINKNDDSNCSSNTHEFVSAEVGSYSGGVVVFSAL